MTQKVFDVENADDMALLWDILPCGIIKINKRETHNTFWSELFYEDIPSGFIIINWHDKTEITRPIQEATEGDVGKLCYFWDYDEQKESGTGSFGKLCIIDEHKVEGTKYQGQNIGWFPHCRRLTKTEIEELC